MFISLETISHIHLPSDLCFLVAEMMFKIVKNIFKRIILCSITTKLDYNGFDFSQHLYMLVFSTKKYQNYFSSTPNNLALE